MKTIKKVYNENFKSISSLLDSFEKRPLNEAFKEADKHSQRVDIDGRFSGVEKYEQAEELLKNGYKEPLERMKQALLKIGKSDVKQRARMKNDFVGFVPHVPNMLNNVPETMINKQRVKNKEKTIHLTYGFTAVGRVNKDSLVEAGINFISLVNSLEKHGYRVKIDVLFCSIANDKACSFTVTIKEYQQTLNLLKLSFPLIHPSMLRRLCFKWLETVPNLKDKNFNNGYGTPLVMALNKNHDKEREFLKEKKIISGENSFYCNFYQAFESTSVEELANTIGL